MLTSYNLKTAKKLYKENAYSFTKAFFYYNQDDGFWIYSSVLFDLESFTTSVDFHLFLDFVSWELGYKDFVELFFKDETSHSKLLAVFDAAIALAEREEK